MSHLTLLEKLDIGNNEFVTVVSCTCTSRVCVSAVSLVVPIQPTVVGSLESLCELWLDSNTINSIPEVSTMQMSSMMLATPSPPHAHTHTHTHTHIHTAVT